MPSHQPTAGHMAVQPQFLSSQPSPMAKTSEPNRNRSYDPRKAHITDSPITKSNWYKHINWLNVTLIVGIPLYGCIQAFWVPLQWRTALFAVVYYFMTGLGVTAGKLYSLTFRPHVIILTITLSKATIGYGLTPRTLLLCHFESFSLLLVVERSKGQLDGGQEITGHIIVTPTPTKTHIPSAKGFCTRISVGW